MYTLLLSRERNTFVSKYLRFFFSECGVTRRGLHDGSVWDETCVVLKDAEINTQFQYLHNFSCCRRVNTLESHKKGLVQCSVSQYKNFQTINTYVILVTLANAPVLRVIKCLEKQSTVLSNSTLSWVKRQKIVLKDKALSWETQPYLERHSPVLRDTALSWEKEHCLERQSTVLSNSIFSWVKRQKIVLN
jgi:hypothetical protein